MFCSNCGQQVRSGQRFCPVCGSLQTSVDANFRGTQQAPAGAYPFTQAVKHHELEGVFGWLRFFCFLITVVAPLGLFVPGRRLPLATEAIIAIQTIFGVLVGANLWSAGRNALEMLKVYFYLTFTLKAVFIFLSLLKVQPVYRTVAEAIGGVISIGLTLVWFLYFRNSVRVKATYGRNL
jgi:zinc ribbon protein